MPPRGNGPELLSTEVLIEQNWRSAGKAIAILTGQNFPSSANELNMSNDLEERSYENFLRIG